MEEWEYLNEKRRKNLYFILKCDQKSRKNFSNLFQNDASMERYHHTEM